MHKNLKASKYKFKNTTFLSPAVQVLFKKSVSEHVNSCFLRKTINGVNCVFLDWKFLHGRTCNLGDGYETCLENLAPFLNCVKQTYSSFSAPEISEHLQWLEWTHTENLFSHSWKLLIANEDPWDIILATLLLTAYIEHALGNVYLIKGKNVPFLMKDLLATEELSEICGCESMQVLKLIMGTPAALNLRNVLWHGFLSPSEIDSRYGLFLIATAVSLGVHLQSCHDKIPERKMKSFDISEVLNDFPGPINFGVLGKIFEGVDCLPQMKPYFHSALGLFENNRFGECVVLLLPVLECIMRVMFAVANECHERTLTAENDTLYTTFDEILSKSYVNSKENHLMSYLDGNLFEMLLDVLNYQQGPRVRDRLSHGEVYLDHVPPKLASHIIHLTAAVCLQLPQTQIQDPYVFSISTTVQNYKSHFHATSLLCSKIRELIVDLLDWQSTSLGKDDVVQKNMELPDLDCFQDLLASIGLDGCLSLEDGGSVLSALKAHLDCLKFHTLFRPRQELEAVSALHQVTKNALKASVNIRTTLYEKHNKFINKQLRSRQRANFQKLHLNYETMQTGFIYLSLLLIHFLATVNRLGELNLGQYEHHLKFLKRTIQYTENLAVSSSCENNDWDGIVELHCKYHTSFSTFSQSFLLK